jgi:hypothetical protein
LGEKNIVLDFNGEHEKTMGHFFWQMNKEGSASTNFG